jgi:hypothetical protein
MGDTVYIRGEGGSVFKLDLPLHEAIEDKLRKGLVHRVNADGTAHTGDDTVPGLPTERPALSAVKLEWVGWAVHEGMDPEDAAALKKQDLIDRFGPDATPTPPKDEADGQGDGSDGGEPPTGTEVADEFSAQQ